MFLKLIFLISSVLLMINVALLFNLYNNVILIGIILISLPVLLIIIPVIAEIISYHLDNFFSKSNDDESKHNKSNDNELYYDELDEYSYNSYYDKLFESDEEDDKKEAKIIKEIEEINKIKLNKKFKKKKIVINIIGPGNDEKIGRDVYPRFIDFINNLSKELNFDYNNMYSSRYVYYYKDGVEFSESDIYITKKQEEEI